jgi:hypothetical protein
MRIRYEETRPPRKPAKKLRPNRVLQQAKRLCHACVDAVAKTSEREGHVSSEKTMLLYHHKLLKSAKFDAENANRARLLKQAEPDHVESVSSPIDDA